MSTLTQKSLWSSPKGYSFKQLDIPTPGSGEVLIKNVAVASNPKDWKLLIWRQREGVEGNDVAGYVESVGSGVTEFKKGDKVGAFTKIADEPKWGAYQEYSIALASNTFPLGEKTSFEDAATLPLALGTAFIGLYRRLGITTVPNFTGNAQQTGTPIVIYGASSSVGSFTVQLAKLSGFFVVGIAGAGADYARSIGADVIVDYRGKSNAELLAEVKTALQGHGALRYVYDAVSSKETYQFVVELLKKHGGTFTSVLPQPDVEIPTNITVDRTLVSTAYGEDEAFAAKLYRQVAAALEAGVFKPNRVRIVPNGLAGVEGGLEELKANKVSAEKLVYRVADTPGLGERYSTA